MFNVIHWWETKVIYNPFNSLVPSNFTKYFVEKEPLVNIDMELCSIGLLHYKQNICNLLSILHVIVEFFIYTGSSLKRMSWDKFWESVAEMIIGATLNIFECSYKAEVFILLIKIYKLNS